MMRAATFDVATLSSHPSTYPILIDGLVSAAALTAELIVVAVAALKTPHNNSFLKAFFIDFLCLSTIRGAPLACS